MSTDTRYNGWPNYETWAVALWLDNDRGLYDQRVELVEQTWAEAVSLSEGRTRSELARYTLAISAKAWIDDMQPDLGATLWSDLLSAAVSEVDWHEIADNWLSELDGYESKVQSHANR